MTKLDNTLERINKSYNNLIGIFVGQLANYENSNRELRKEIIRQEEIIRGLSSIIYELKQKENK